ncbi:MAG: CYTH domain-containing protein [Butyrivibrio sp.]|nr:CYTH domain-containing protein [Butyrivibrio sp.]
MEIERKYLIKKLPQNLQQFSFHEIEQGYLNRFPTVRVRKEDDEYYMTYKGAGVMAKEEYNLALNAESYIHMKEKCDGNIITKRRYLIPINEDAFTIEEIEKDTELRKDLENKTIKIELDIFEGIFKGLVVAEVEFPSEYAANVYHPAEWFKEDVTEDRRFSNANLSSMNEKEIYSILNNYML